MDNRELRFFSLRSAMILLYCVVVAVIPLALRMRLVEFHAPVETWQRLGSAASLEVFAQFRLELLVIAGICIAITALLKIYYDADKKIAPADSYAGYPAALFAFLVVLSALCSPYIRIAFWGYPDRAEGAFAYLFYLLIFLVAANLLNAEIDKKIIFYVAIAAGLLQSGIAISQFFGFDLLKSALAQRLFIPPEYAEMVGDVEFIFTNKAYGTTYNPNYLGGYMAMILPMVFVRYLFARNGREMVFWLLALFVTTAGFLAPTSIGAFVAVVAVLLVFFLLTAGQIRRYYPKLLCALLIFVAVAGFSEMLSGGMISRKFISFYSRMQDLPLAAVSQQDDGYVEGEGPAASRPGSEQGSVLIPEAGKAGDGGTGIGDAGDDAGKPGPASMPKLTPATDREKIVLGLDRHPLDSFASHRGYIWRKTWQMMLQDNLLLGSGFDTFVYNFPHWDPHRDHGLFRIGLLIDKPHNTYLQIGTGAGFLALLVYLFLLGVHGFHYIRVYRERGLQAESDIIMLALFAGWLGYLLQGLSNDSVLSNAPVFWALFGLSVNYVQNHLNSEGRESRRPTVKKRSR
ncbi:MAG: hypothetical protein GX325_10650 [Peptococcaceae bacterium]|nr:hypothetical protein [Peptococcaceae bacterium]